MAPVPQMPQPQFTAYFGRGDRASRQRLAFQVYVWGGVMRVQSLRLRVMRTFAPDFTLVSAGLSLYQGKRKVFFTSQFLEGFKALLQAVGDAKETRRRNKVIQAARKKALDNNN